MKTEEQNATAIAPAADEGKTGYRRPPAKNRFPKGKSGNPFGRRKGQRNLATVLSDVLLQHVTVKQGSKSERLTKGEALIKLILNKANNGDRRAISAVSYLAEQIGRVDNSDISPRGGVMLVPGVSKSIEEWVETVAKGTKERELRDRQRMADAPGIRKKEASLRIAALHKGTPEGDTAAASLAELTGSMEYISNFYINHIKEPEPLQMAPGPVYRKICPRGSPGVSSSVKFTDLPPDHPHYQAMPNF